MYPLYKQQAISQVIEQTKKKYPESFDNICHIQYLDQTPYIIDKYNRLRLIDELDTKVIYHLLNMGLLTHNLKIGVHSLPNLWDKIFWDTVLVCKDDCGNINTTSKISWISDTNGFNKLPIIMDASAYDFYIDNFLVRGYDDEHPLSILLLIIDPLSYVNKILDPKNQIGAGKWFRKYNMDLSPAIKFFKNLEGQILTLQQKQIQKYLLLSELVMDDIIFEVIQFWAYIEASV